MTIQEQSESLWVVMKVESGIPVMVQACLDRQCAQMREQVLRQHMHPENDETGVFEIQSDAEVMEYRTTQQFRYTTA